MTKDDIHLLYAFDRWANSRVLDAAATLSSEQFTRDLGGAFASVRDTLVHILAAEWIWLHYWKAASDDAAAMAELRARRDALFHPQHFPDVASAQSKWHDIEREQIAFVDRLTCDQLQTQIATRGTQMSLAHLMQHMANHSTYHRGQIALMMRQLHAQPIATDFHLFISETGAGSHS